MTTCTLLFLRRDDEILLAMKKRGFGAGLWNGAGGKIKPSETIEQAMIRETEEEVGVTPLDYQKVARHSFTFPAGPDQIPDIAVHCFVCTKWQGTLAETEEMAPRWFKLGDIPYGEMWEDDLLWLPLVLQGKKLITSFGFTADNHLISAHIDIVKDLQA